MVVYYAKFRLIDFPNSLMFQRDGATSHVIVALQSYLGIAPFLPWNGRKEPVLRLLE